LTNLPQTIPTLTYLKAMWLVQLASAPINNQIHWMEAL